MYGFDTAIFILDRANKIVPFWLAKLYEDPV
jgi:hypothetical protein